MSNSTIPFGVLSSIQAERLLGINIKKKKEYTTELMEMSLDFKGFVTYEPNTKDASFLVRESILDAITSPYLRGVIACFFGKLQTTVHFSQVKQNPITKLEFLGIVTSCYEDMSRHENQKFTFSFRERKETHMIEGSGFSQFLIDRSNELKDCEVLIINVHHDYIKGYSNIGDETILLDLIREVSSTNHARFVKKG